MSARGLGYRVIVRRSDLHEVVDETVRTLPDALAVLGNATADLASEGFAPVPAFPVDAVRGLGRFDYLSRETEHARLPVSARVIVERREVRS